MNTHTTTVLATFIQRQADVLRDTVKEIEASPEVCHNHYDRYMLLISECNKIKHSTKLWAVVLIKAGANVPGVEAAVNILGN